MVQHVVYIRVLRPRPTPASLRALKALDEAANRGDLDDEILITSLVVVEFVLVVHVIEEVEVIPHGRQQWLHVDAVQPNNPFHACCVDTHLVREGARPFGRHDGTIGRPENGQRHGVSGLRKRQRPEAVVFRDATNLVNDVFSTHGIPPVTGLGRSV
jgi:hypothetical protein